MTGRVDVPAEAAAALLIVREYFATSLVAVYLHGSAVAGGLRPHSDVDLLVVIERAMTAEMRKRLLAGLLRISGRYPSDPDGRRPLELIVFARADLAAPLDPARCEFVYGEWLRHEFEAGAIPAPVRDPELTLLLAQARREAVALVGPGAAELLPVVPRSNIHRAIGELLPVLIESLAGDERNVLLTLARMWRTLVTGEFVAKDVAADWAGARLPFEQAAVLADARAFYLGEREEDWNARRQAIRRTVNSLRDHVMANL